MKAKNKKGYTWAFTIEIGIDPETGKRKQLTRRGFETKKDAEIASGKIQQEIENDEFIQPKKVLVKDFMVDWLNNIAKQNVKPSTFSGYKGVVAKRIIPIFGALKLEQLKPIMITKYYNSLLEEGLSEEYIDYIHSILKTPLNTAIKWEFIKTNPVVKADKPSIKKKSVSTWSIEECNAFLSKANEDSKPHFYILYLLAIYTGMRRGEILGLKWSDIIFPQKKISIARTLYYIHDQGIIEQSTKNDGSNRVISISDMVISELKKHQLWQKERKLKYGIPYSEDGYITANHKGEALNPNYVYNHFIKMIKKTGLKKIRFHDLRHTHATIMLQLGEHPKIVSERLGHSSIEMTMNTYSHVTPDMQQDSSDRFEEALKNAKNP
ncbi:tyrosine-type recombinase/integrase [Peribacillus loiseleuriae]|uniref:site-specific integrase n=1 Tax=Peribacillus loiseleuriae TaxID=1679170 RepID=UPI003CFE114E